MVHVQRLSSPGLRCLWIGLLLGSVFGCHGDAMGPRGALLVQLLPARDSVLKGAPGRALAQPVRFRALDAATLAPVAGADVVWTVTGAGGHVDQAAATTGADGSFDGTWVLGTRAAEVQRLRADVSAPGRTAFNSVRAVAVPVDVVKLTLFADTTPVLAGTTRVLRAWATDPFGNRFIPTRLHFASLDTAIVTVDSLGTLRGSVSGYARVQVAAGQLADTSTVRVIQVLDSIKVNHDTLRFWALRQVDTLTITLLDTQGLPIHGLEPTVSLQDTALARVRVDRVVTVTSAKNGTTTLLLQGGGKTRQVVVQIQQLPALLQAAVTYPNAIFVAQTGSVVPLECRVFDSFGNPIAIDPTMTSATGAVAGSHCSDVHLQHSGLDTVRLAAGSATAAVPVVVALPPVVSSPIGDLIQVDSMPNGEPWAVSARRNSRGQMEVYFGSLVDTANDYHYEDLHRLVSDDGRSFRYDGLVFAHDSVPCSLHGFGFENVAVVPRQDAPGWRMYVSSGQFTCYGWQVFSAVSTDEKNWTLEPGIRLRDGQSPVSDPSVPPPYWPTGEGMVVDQLPSGGWRMLLGAYEHVDPYEDKFQIIEWHSPDQLNWTYQGPVLTTRQMPAADQGSVYSPTIKQVAPGLWRMIFTTDSRPQAGWHSRLWSALSTDLKTWQLEGQLLGSDATSLYYSALVGDRLVFIRHDDGDWRNYIGIATVSMP